VTALVLCAVAALADPRKVWAQASNATLEQYLSRIGIDARDRANAARGRAVAKLLPTKDNRDVTVFGIVGVNIPRDTAVARVLDIQQFLAARGIRAHPFGNPPSSADVGEATFAEGEYRGLRNCRPTDCDYKLSASQMREFIDGVDWSARDAKAQADARLRDDLLALAADYTKRGNAALPTYDDGRNVNSADAIAAQLAESSDFYPPAPELLRYVATYHAERPEGAHDFLYWSEDRLPHLRPTLTVNHAVVYVPPANSPGAVFALRKQLYATHYFEGALEMLAMVDGGDAPGEPRLYMITVRRFRFDALPGGLLNIRGRVRRGLADVLRADLVRQRSALQPGSTH
jgi:hypothetical protein